MKKIMFMLLFIVGCMTSLAALDLGPPQKGAISQSMQWDEVHDTISLTIHQEVNILHRDSLMYSWGEGIDHNIKNVNGVICDIVGVSPYGRFEVG